MDVTGLPGMHARYAEGVEGGGAIVEKQNVRAGVFAVAGIDTFVFAIVNPEAIKNNRHAGKSSCSAEFIARGAFRDIHGDAREWPLLGSGS